MKINLLRGIQLQATVRPMGCIDISWGRPGLKLAKKQYVDNIEVRKELGRVASELNHTLKLKGAVVDIAKKIKDVKEEMYEYLKPYLIKEGKNA